MQHSDALLQFMSRYVDYSYTGPHDFERPESLPWVGHMAFADMLVRAYRPELLVELGAYTGVSFFSFCNAVRQAWLHTSCCAVDTWKGEHHAGYYGEEVFAAVERHTERNYAEFARLLRMTFDEAVDRFAAGSVYILHIDGLHTYEAVRHDFDTWLPKVRPGGIVLFHDVVEQHDDFGVWKLWDEIESLTPESCCFRHSHGLGVWRKPGGPELEHPFLRALFDRPEGFEAVAAFVRAVAERQELQRRAHALERLAEERQEQINACQAESEARQAVIDDCNARLEQRAEELRAARDEMCERDAAHQREIDALRCEKARVEEAYDRILRSRSWLVTRPLRFAAEWIRKRRAGSR